MKTNELLYCIFNSHTFLINREEYYVYNITFDDKYFFDVEKVRKKDGCNTLHNITARSFRVVCNEYDWKAESYKNSMLSNLSKRHPEVIRDIDKRVKLFAKTNQI